MKNTLLTTICIFITFISLGQSSIIDLDKPLSRIDVGYSVDNNLIFTLILNTKENTQNLQNSSPINFKAFIEGQINWTNPEQDPNKKILVGNFNPISSSNPFNFIADAKDGSSAAVPSPSKRPWKSIEQVKLKFEIEGKSFELPYLTIYPPTVSQSITEIIVSTQAKMLGKQKGEIKIIANDGTPFEITLMEITRRKPGEGESKTIISGKDLGEKRFANSGVLDFPISTPFELDNSATYLVTANVRKIGLPEYIKMNSIEVVFTDESIRRVIDKQPNYSISIDDQDIITEMVRTEGKGELGIRFASREYNDKIRVSKKDLDGGLFEFKLEGLDQLPEDSFDYFYFTVNGNDLPQHYLITKKSPVVSDFRFIGTKKDDISLEFRLPEYVNKESISIDIIGEKGNIEVKGSAILQSDQSDRSKFQAILPNQLTDLVARDTLIDVNIIIKYSNRPLYSLGLSFFNQNLLNQKVSQLVAETANKPNKRDSEKIKLLVEDIVKIGGAVGNSINDDEVKNAIEALSGNNKEKIQNTMFDIGKWALIAGKIVLPLVL